MLTSEDAEVVPELSTGLASQSINSSDLTDYNSCLAGLSKSIDELERALRLAARRSKARRRRVDGLPEDDFLLKISRVK